MRVLQVITSMRVGGAERLVTQLLPRFRNAGIEVELAVFDATPTGFLSEVENSGIKIHKLGIGIDSIYNPIQILRIRKLTGKFDIVHTHNYSCQLYTAIATIFSGKCPILVTTEHNTDNRRREWQWYRPMDRWMYHRYNAITCCSDATRIKLEKSLNDDTIHAETITNGVDLNKISSSGSTYRLTHPAIVMVAAFRPQKDHITAIRALRLLPHAHLYLAGDGSDRNAIENHVKQAGLSDRVHFLGNIANVGELYKSADCAILCSKYEGFGLSAVEAMASGVPFIASDVPGLREIVKGAGLLVPPSDETALAEAISNVLTDKKLRDSLVPSEIARASQYSIDNTAQQYIQLYNNLIHQ